MTRKFILAIAAIATLAPATLVSIDAQAKPNAPIKIVKPIHPHWHGHHIRPVYIVDRPYVRPVALVSPARNTCNCLTKEYTPEGVVVFKDLCTKEMASAPVDGAPAQSSEAERPQNFAGKTFKDFQAANPQPEQKN